MLIIHITVAEFEEFRDVQIRPRADWPATFSCNYKGEVWPFITNGLTPEGLRDYMQGEIPRLDEIVQVVLAEQDGGGRFHMDENGVFLAESEEQVARFVITP